MSIKRQQLQIWRQAAEDVLNTGDITRASVLAREAIPQLIDEVVRLSAGSERDQIAALMAQALVTGQVAVAVDPTPIADKAYVLADALLAKRNRL